MSISWFGSQNGRFWTHPKHTNRHGYWLTPRVNTSLGLSWYYVVMSLDTPLDRGLMVMYLPPCQSWPLVVWTPDMSPKVMILGVHYHEVSRMTWSHFTRSSTMASSRTPDLYTRDVGFEVIQVLGLCSKWTGNSTRMSLAVRLGIPDLRYIGTLGWPDKHMESGHY